MKSRCLVIATRNPGKVREISQVLADLKLKIVALDGFGDIPEPQEHGETFADNARDKALYYARATGQWCLADDSGLVVDALGGKPGVHSARYAADTVRPGASRHEIDQANNAKLLAAIDSIPDRQRTARFVCHLAMADPWQVLLEAHGTIEGVMLRAPAGSGGFGYDPLFYVPSEGCTTAQLPAERKNAISHRGQALRQFSQLLHEMLSS